MKNKRLITILSIVLAVVVVAGVSAYAATNFGTSSDPLITLSYLEQTLTPELMEQFGDELEAALDAYSGSSQTDTYKVVTLSSGQTLIGNVGCEIMLRTGSATVSAAASPGLIDATDAASLENGASLTANHLYMVTADGNGVVATASSVQLIVRGAYTIG